MTTVTNGTAKGLRARLLLAAFCGMAGCCVAVASSEASTIGVSFTGATTPDYPTDGAIVLDIQTQHAIPSAGLIDSYTFIGSTATVGDGTAYGFGPYNYDFMIFRPTGTANQFTVVYDSGAQVATTNGIQTVNITPVSVLAGDVIGDYGRAIGLSITGPDPTLFYQAVSQSTPAPSGTFTAGDSPYPAYGGTRTYFLQADFITVSTPEPSSAVLALLGLAGCWAVSRWRRRRASA